MSEMKLYFYEGHSKDLGWALHTPLLIHRYLKLANALSTVDVLEAEYQGELTHAFSHFRVHLKHYKLKVHSQDIAEIGMWRPN